MLDMSNKLEPQVEKIRFRSGPGEISGTLYLPVGEPSKVAVVNSATGVSQGFYTHFARWLAREHGMACLTYDYRDFGDSLTGNMADSDATMVDWAILDQPAARAELRRRFPGKPIWVFGHSLGTMVMPLQPGLEDVERVIGVASGLVNVSDHPWPYRALVYLFWYGHVPLAARMLGYLPGRLVGFGADLPLGVYKDWRRWCTDPSSFLQDSGDRLPDLDWRHTNIRVDYHAFSDDHMMPPVCTERLVRLFGEGKATFHVHDPQSMNLKSVGHLGAFNRRNADIWPALVA